ncbi:hypothetical protein [Nocardioides convexus]|uniref:hypothetical protein n=1 Tax=Nocardioides convexus TaxID=2712224 RepID=UPI00241831D8|nr:hypothetical protein [Nocardioides convexus]
MQQVGGALGLATLSTVALHFTNSQADKIAKPMADAIVAGGGDPTAPVPGTDLTFLEGAIFGSRLSRRVRCTPSWWPRC